MPVTAQIVPDATLPNSIVTLNGKTSTITGGTQAGGNLFHSFKEFSVLTGGTAFFNNAVNIQNIITRVTGGSISNIDGLIKANGIANLFFINPNGIIFGPNASLNIGGSFVASTANSLKFADGTEFSATNPQASPLLTISVPSGLQFGSNPGKIVNQANDPNGEMNSATMLPIGLQVPDGKTLALVGGDVSLDGGNLTAPGGRIELGSVGSGLVNLTAIPQGYALEYSGVQNFQNIGLSNSAAVDASGVGGGSIQLKGGNINLTSGAQISSITQGAGTGGNLTVDAAESVKLSGQAALATYTLGTGSAGNLTITTRKLTVESGAFIETPSTGQGPAGDLLVKATDAVELSGMSADGMFSSGLFAFVQSTATGKSGNLTIETGQLTIRDGAIVDASTFGKPTGGNVQIKASNVALEGYGTTPQGLQSSGIFAQVAGVGKGGDIRINADSLSVTNGAQLFAATLGQGNAGNVIINARGNVSFDGTSTNGQIPSAAFSTVEQNGLGNGGDIRINAGSLFVTNGAQLSARTLGKGDAGNVTILARDTISLDGADSVISSTLGTSSAPIVRVNVTEQPTSGNQKPKLPKVTVTVEPRQQNVFPSASGNSGNIDITARSLSVTNGAQLTTSTVGQGSAGNIKITADDSVLFRGNNSKLSPSSASSTVQKGAVGNSGNIDITTTDLRIVDGAQLIASTLGNGNAGDIRINANNVSFDGVGTNASPSGAFSAVTETGTGKGGSINIDARNSISVTNGAQVSANSSGRGDAGSITIQGKTVSVHGYGVNSNNPLPSRVSSAVESVGVGNGGSLTILADRLNIQNRAEGTVNNQGSGDAGNLIIKADSINLDNFGKLTANSLKGVGGNVELQVQDFLLLRNNSEISAVSGTTSTGGAGGNFFLNSKFIIARENSDIVTNAFAGTGGNIDIISQGIFGAQFRRQRTPDSDIVASGQVRSNTPIVNNSLKLVELPTVLAGATALKNTSCEAFAEENGSSFTVTGRGGLPPNPYDPLSGEILWTDTRIPNITSQQRPEKTPTKPQPQANVREIVPATGWVFSGNGFVTLISNAHGANSLTSTPTNCPQQ